MEKSKRVLKENEFVFVDNQKANEENVITIIAFKKGDNQFEYQGDREDVVKLKHPELYAKVQEAIDNIIVERGVGVPVPAPVKVPVAPEPAPTKPVPTKAPQKKHKQRK